MKFGSMPKNIVSCSTFIVFALFFISFDKVLAQPRLDTLQDNAIILKSANNFTDPTNRSWEGIPSIVSTKDMKQIYVAWYSGGKNEGPNNYVTVSVSVDSGSTWKSDKLLVFPKNSYSRFFDPAMWRDENDEIWLYYTCVYGPKFWDMKGGVYAMKISWKDDTIHNSIPIRISDGVMMNSPVFVKEKNVSLFPISVWRLFNKDFESLPSVKDGTFIKVLKKNNNVEDMGHVEHYGLIPALADSLRTYDEHQIVQTSEKGDFLGMVRTRNGIYYSESNDYGQNWSYPKPFTATGPTTSSRIHLSRLLSGNLLLIINNSNKRNNMTVFLSKNGGKSWPFKLFLDHRDLVSYPDASQSDDGLIHVSYDRDRYNDRDIYYLNFTEDDIIHGREQNIKRSMVSSGKVSNK